MKAKTETDIAISKTLPLNFKDWVESFLAFFNSYGCHKVWPHGG